MYKAGCRCSERLTDKAGGGESLSHTRWSGGKTHRTGQVQGLAGLDRGSKPLTLSHSLDLRITYKMVLSP